MKKYLIFLLITLSNLLYGQSINFTVKLNTTSFSTTGTNTYQIVGTVIDDHGFWSAVNVAAQDSLFYIERNIIYPFVITSRTFSGSILTAQITSVPTLISTAPSQTVSGQVVISRKNTNGYCATPAGLNSALTWALENRFKAKLATDVINAKDVYFYVGTTDVLPSVSPPTISQYLAKNSANQLYQWNGTAWVLIGNNIIAVNGITKSGDTLKLGGTLNQPTTIITSPTNPLKITATQVNPDANGYYGDDLLLGQGLVGGLKYYSTSNFLQHGDTLRNGYVNPKKVATVFYVDSIKSTLATQTTITPEMYGAKGDGVTDDYLALQQMLDTAILKKYAVSLKGRKTYYTSNNLTLQCPSQWFGDNGLIPTLVIQGNGAKISFATGKGMIKIPLDQSSAGQQVNSRVIISNLNFIGTGASNNATLLTLGATYGSVIENCSFNGAKILLDLQFCLAAKINSCFFQNCDSIGLYIRKGTWSGASGSNSQSNVTTVNGARFYGVTNQYTQSYVDVSSNVTFNDCIYEGGNPRHNAIWDGNGSTNYVDAAYNNLHLENTPSVASIWLTGGTGIANFKVDRTYWQYPHILIYADTTARYIINFSNPSYWVGGTKFRAGKTFSGTNGACDWYFRDMQKVPDFAVNSTYFDVSSTGALPFWNGVQISASSFNSGLLAPHGTIGTFIVGQNGNISNNGTLYNNSYVYNKNGVFFDGAGLSHLGWQRANNSIFNTSQKVNTQDLLNYYGFNNGNILYRNFSGNIHIGASSGTDTLQNERLTISDYSRGNPLRLQGLQEGTSADSLIVSQNGVLKRLAISQVATGGTDTTKVTKNGDSPGATLAIGTNDTNDVVIETNNAPRVTIGSSPSAYLKLGSTNGLEIHSTNPSNYGLTVFNDAYSTTSPQGAFWAISTGEFRLQNQNVGESLQFATNTGGTAVKFEIFDDKSVFYNTPLWIRKSTNSQKNIDSTNYYLRVGNLENIINSYTTMGFGRASSNGHHPGAIAFKHTGTYNGEWHFATRTANTDGVIPTTKMVITANGNIGINDTLPSNKLTVVGTDPLKLTGLQQTTNADTVLVPVNGVIKWAKLNLSTMGSANLFKTNENVTSYFFGHSNVSNPYYHPDTTTKMQHQFRLALNQSNVVNYAFSGAKLANGMRVADQVPIYNSALHGYMLIGFADNEFLHPTTSPIDTATYKATLISKIDSVTAKGWVAKNIIVPSLWWVTERERNLYVTYGENAALLTDAKAQEWNKMLKGVCDTKGTVYVDLYSITKADTTVFGADGSHSNPYGTGVVTKQIVSTLKGLSGHTDLGNYYPVISTPNGFQTGTPYLALRDTAEVFNGIRVSVPHPTGPVVDSVIDSLGKFDSPFNDGVWLLEAFNGYSTTYIANTEFSTTVSGTGAVAGTVAPNSTTFGTSCMQLSTGTTATGLAHFGSTSAAMSNIRYPYNGINHVFQCDVIVPNLSTSTDSFDLQIGFFDNLTVGSNNTDAICFYYRHDINGGDWSLSTRSNVTETLTDLNTVVTASTKYKLKIVCKIGGKVDAYINGVKVASDIMTNVPTAGARLYGYGAMVRKLGGTTARTLQIDNVQIKTD